MSPKFLSRSDVEALIAEAREQAAGFEERFEIKDWEEDAADLLLKIADALELSLSPTPTGDEREHLFKIVEAAHFASWSDGGEYMESPDEVTDAILAAGFRVTPEPVYEYRRVDQNGRVRFGAEFSSMPLLDEGWSAERRTVGVWELVPVGVEKP